MLVRLANLGLLLALAAFLLGIFAFLAGSQPSGWTDFSRGLRWLAAGSPAVAILATAAGTLPLLLAALVLLQRGRARLRRELGGRVPPPPQVSGARQRAVTSARRLLDREICRRQPQVELVVDALLGALVDLPARSFRLDPDGQVAEVAYQLEHELHPLATMPLPLHLEILEQLRLLTGIEDGGEGRLDFLSTDGVQELQIHLTGGTRGMSARVEILGRREEPYRPETQPLPGRPRHRRRTVATLVRRERPLSSHHQTGEHSVPFARQGDPTDSHSGLLSGLDPSAEHEVMPLMAPRLHRPVAAVEGMVRLLAAVALLGLVLLGGWRTYALGWQALAAGRIRGPWRAVTLEIVSTPPGSRVRIDGQPRGTTPLVTVEECRDRPLLVVVEAAGHQAWQWTGICTGQGPLRLEAALQLAK